MNIAMRLFLVGIMLAGASSLGVAPIMAGCKDKPLLLQKAADGTLSEKESKRLNRAMKWWLQQVDDYANERDSYLAFAAQPQSDSTELSQRKEEFFYESVSHLQFGVEAYASLNDGMYPYSVGALVCSGMMEELPVNPFTEGPLQEMGLTSLASGEYSGVAYVPQYVRVDGKALVVGYWLLAVSPEIHRAEAVDTADPAEPLPGNWPLPPDAVLILESHPAE